MGLCNGLHIYYLDLICHDKFVQSNLLPPTAFPQHTVETAQQSAQVIPLAISPRGNPRIDFVSQSKLLGAFFLDGLIRGPEPLNRLRALLARGEICRP